MYGADPDDTEQAFYSWALGFMSGWNVANSVAKEPMHNLSSTPTPAQESYLRTYCDQHPLQSYMQGVMALFGTLPPTR
jgi:hypothetical protein